MEIVEFLKNPGKFTKLGGKIPKGALLVGPPGTGKTLLAKAVAGEAGVPFFSLSGSDFVEMFVGVGAARVRDLFARAQAQAPSIVVIDERDAVGKARGISPGFGGHDEHEQTLNQLLAELDGFDTQAGVIILAATNRPEILDPALLRPGRFDRQVVIDRPDLKGREKNLRGHTRAVTLAPDLDLSLIAARTPGFVGADLANLVNQGALHAAREGKEAGGLTDFDHALDRVVGGVAALGYTQQQPTEDRYLMTRAELLDRLDVLLGGRVAEEIIFGDVSTGAHDDLQRASDLVRHMVTQYGMSHELGLGTFERPRSGLFLGGPGPGDREYSEDTARMIDAERRRLLEAAHLRVQTTLKERRTLREVLAKVLIEKEVVDRDALTALLA